MPACLPALLPYSQPAEGHHIGTLCAHAHSMLNSLSVTCNSDINNTGMLTGTNATFNANSMPCKGVRESGTSACMQ